MKGKTGKDESGGKKMKKKSQTDRGTRRKDLEPNWRRDDLSAQKMRPGKADEDS